MTPLSATILLGAPPGRQRDGLQLLLSATPGVGDVQPMDDLAALLTAVQTRSPALVVVDVAFEPDRIWILPGLLAVLDRRPPLLFIVATGEQRERARRIGADAVLLRGFSVTELHATMADLFVGSM